MAFRIFYPISSHLIADLLLSGKHAYQDRYIPPFPTLPPARPSDFCPPWLILHTPVAAGYDDDDDERHGN